MSFIIAVYVNEGIVLASDRRTTYTITEKKEDKIIQKIGIHTTDSTDKTFICPNGAGISTCGIAGGHQIDEYIGSDKICYVFIEGPISVTLLGVKFNLYSRSIMNGFRITNIEWRKENEEGEVYITDSDDNPWTLSRHYCSEQEAVAFRKDLDSRIGAN